jgi:hypothetical protein
MRCPTGATNTTVIPSLARLDHDGERPLRCVWTNHPSHDHHCREKIPRAVVITAWRRELERGHARADRFFHFAWRGGVWLAYGLLDGDVRGVYCPGHSAARDAHSLVPDEDYSFALTA